MQGIYKLDSFPHGGWCCCCYWRADSETSALNEVVQPNRVLDGFPNLCCPERYLGLNKIRHTDWVKLCVDTNGRIKLRAKQKYEMSSATYPSSNSSHFITFTFVLIPLGKAWTLISPPAMGQRILLPLLQGWLINEGWYAIKIQNRNKFRQMFIFLDFISGIGIFIICFLEKI